MRGHRAVALLAAAIALGAALCGIRPAYGALGDAESSIETDLAGLSGQMQTLVENGVRTSRVTTAAGTIIKEFASPGGRVFALSWRGPKHPDLAALLGSYFAEYQQGASQPRTRRRHLVVQTERVVVETSGHMGDVRGKAYVRSLLPAGFDPGDIR